MWEPPSGPVIGSPHFTAKGMGSAPGLGTKVTHAARHSLKKKKKEKENSTCAAKARRTHSWERLSKIASKIMFLIL